MHRSPAPSSFATLGPFEIPHWSQGLQHCVSHAPVRYQSKQLPSLALAPVALARDVPATTLPTFAQCASDFLIVNPNNWSASTAKVESSTLNGRLLKRFGTMPVDQINEREIEKYLHELKSEPGNDARPELSPIRRMGILRGLFGVLNYAGKTYGIRVPVKPALTLVRTARQSPLLGLGEVRQLLGACGANHQHYLTTQFFSGLTIGETIALRWPDVDLDDRRIAVSRPTQRRRARIVDMSPEVETALRAQHAITSPLGGTVFCSFNATPLDVANLTHRVWKPLAASLGMGHVHLNQLVHSTAAMWLREGKSPEWIVGQLGRQINRNELQAYHNFNATQAQQGPIAPVASVTPRWTCEHAPALFKNHARRFIEVMPRIKNWGLTHTYVTRTTIENRLIPEFGDRLLSSIDTPEIERYAHRLAQTPSLGHRPPLSTYRIKNIARLLAQIVKTPWQELELDAKAPSATGPDVPVRGHWPLKRQTKETRLWKAACKHFAALWLARTSDEIGNEHPLQDWVTRQRKLARNGKLQAWKRDMLDTIGFPYLAARVVDAPSDLGHAKALHAFYDEHGHYAPTVTIGGTALTRWVRLMRQSGGTHGLISGNAKTAKLALRYLKSHIAGFNLANTHKAELNAARGLSFNGYAKATVAVNAAAQVVGAQSASQAANEPRVTAAAAIPDTSSNQASEPIYRDNAMSQEMQLSTELQQALPAKIELIRRRVGISNAVMTPALAKGVQDEQCKALKSADPLEIAACACILWQYGLSAGSSSRLLKAMTQVDYENPLTVRPPSPETQPATKPAPPSKADRVQGVAASVGDELLTTDELAKIIKYDVRTIRERLTPQVMEEGVHYIRPFGRKILYKKNAVRKLMGLEVE
jgi:integrase